MKIDMTCLRVRFAANPRFAFRYLSFLLVLAIVPGVVAIGVAQSLVVTNTDGHATTISAAEIASAGRVSVSVDDHGTAAKFEGVPLATVLTMAGIQLGDSLRGPRMAEVLLVTASDGYKVAFALAETDPAFAARQIILADKRDGKPLDAREAPFRIIAPGRQKTRALDSPSHGDENRRAEVIFF